MSDILNQDSIISDNKADAKWYVVHTYSGYENKVKINIEATVKNRHLENEIIKVIVPHHDVAEIKDGVSNVKSKKSFPGYVMVNMVMNDDNWYVVRNTRGVTGFVGPGSEPVALTEDEVLKLGIASTEIEIDVEVGDQIIVTSGPWKGTEAVIGAINDKNKTVNITVDVFGRETPLDISLSDIRKL